MKGSERGWLLSWRVNSFYWFWRALSRRLECCSLFTLIYSLWIGRPVTTRSRDLWCGASCERERETYESVGWLSYLLSVVHPSIHPLLVFAIRKPSKPVDIHSQIKIETNRIISFERRTTNNKQTTKARKMKKAHRRAIKRTLRTCAHFNI